jgi:capsular polysaccharide biosynthesis protein
VRKIRTSQAYASLAVLVQQHVLRGNLPPGEFLTELDNQVKLHPGGTVAVLADFQPSSLGAHVARAYPDVRVVEVDPKQPASALHAFLAARGPFHVIAEDARPVGRSSFRNVFFHLAPGGAFIMRLPQRKQPGVEEVQQFVQRILQEQATRGECPATARLDEARLAESIGEVIPNRSHLVVTSKVGALAKMREEEVNTVLLQRVGASGRILDKRPGLTWASRCDVHMSASTAHRQVPKTYQVPDMFLREYYDVVCLPRQIAVQGNLILPDSYRHNQQKRLNHTFIDELSPRFARPVADMSTATALSGSYFYLDSEMPGHFGHSMTEQMSRLWAWQQAKRVEPNLRVLRSLRRPGTNIKAHELHIFGSAGIDAADIVLFDAAVRVERLVAATPMFSMPAYVHPDICEVWNSIGRQLAASAPRREYPKRIFCARRKTKRQCGNATKVESVFADRGFEVIYPEDFPLPEQAAIFRNADIVAGYAGSAMFTLAFCETPKRVILISSEIYNAQNEYMICSVLGHQLNVLWCEPDADQAAKNWERPSNMSSFTFDFAREGLFLEQVLASL